LPKDARILDVGCGASTLGANGFDPRQMAADCQVVLEHFAVAGGVLAVVIVLVLLFN